MKDMKTDSSNSSSMSEDRIAAILERVGRREEPSPERVAAARGAVHAAWQQAVNERKRQSRRYVAWAAAASILVAIAISFPLLSPPAVEPAMRLVQRVNTLELRHAGGSWETAVADAELLPGDTLRTSGNSFAALHSESGLDLRIDQNSELRIVAADAVYLGVGGIYADAAGDATLAVETRLGEVRDIGTRYEVRVEDNQWRVQVREGAVVVNLTDGAEATATAGERLLLVQNAISRESVTPTDASWQWTHTVSPAITLDTLTLLEYLHWWSRESGVVVRFDSDVEEALAAQTRLHGDISTLGLQEGLRAVLSSTGHRAVDAGDGELIVSR